MTEYFGKYRGTVKNNQDPNKLGRLQVSVPEILDTDNKNWARPCVPYAGKDIGMLTIPQKGAKVWREFETGNRERLRQITRDGEGAENRQQVRPQKNGEMKKILLRY